MIALPASSYDRRLRHSDCRLTRRENQQLWFGKRGTSAIGFMVIANDGKGGRLIKFYMMFTDDGCQDEYSVACAKMILYSTYIPADFPGKTKSLFKVDGAACFDSGYSHALQPMWVQCPYSCSAITGGRFGRP